MVVQLNVLKGENSTCTSHAQYFISEYLQQHFCCLSGDDVSREGLLISVRIVLKTLITFAASEVRPGVEAPWSLLMNTLEKATQYVVNWREADTRPPRVQMNWPLLRTLYAEPASVSLDEFANTTEAESTITATCSSVQ